jgi:hypothetical protein
LRDVPALHDLDARKAKLATHFLSLKQANLAQYDEWIEVGSPVTYPKAPFIHLSQKPKRPHTLRGN